MSENDYQSGYRGGQFHHGMDRAEYERGKGQKGLEDTLGGAGKKTEVSGVAYTLILIGPLLFTVYPALGFTILAAIGATIAAMGLFPNHFYLIMFIGFILGVFSFFPGLALEAKASQIGIYRHLRSIWRIFNFLIWPLIILSGRDPRTAGAQVITNAAGETLFAVIIITIIVHFVMRRCDRIYFPNLKEVQKIQKMQEKGEPLKRNFFKRIFYGFLWIVPVFCVLNLAIRLIVGTFLENKAITSFYKDYSIYIYIFDAIIWYLLCLRGILPGTAKTKKSHIDHSQMTDPLLEDKKMPLDQKAA